MVSKSSRMATAMPRQQVGTPSASTLPTSTDTPGPAKRCRVSLVALGDADCGMDWAMDATDFRIFLGNARGRKKGRPCEAARVYVVGDVLVAGWRRLDVDLDATVQLPSLGRIVRRLRARFAEAVDGDHVRADALVDEVVRHARGAVLGQHLVVRVAAGRIGVAFDVDVVVRILPEVRGQLVERVARGAAQRIGVGVEEDVVRQTNGDLSLGRTRHFDAFDL